jgi:hypothetical protein
MLFLLVIVCPPMGNLWVETHIPHILYKGFCN